MKIAAFTLLFACAGTAAAAQLPDECQMKSAYVEFVVASRQDGISESAIPDLYGARLDRAWKERTRHAIYTDANLALSDPMRVAEIVYRECQSARAQDSARWRGAFSLPPSH